jgi:hypothetical protein
MINLIRQDIWIANLFRIKQNIKFYSPINREFYLAKGTEKIILGKYLPSGILLMLLSMAGRVSRE